MGCVLFDGTVWQQVEYSPTSRHRAGSLRLGERDASRGRNTLGAAVAVVSVVVSATAATSPCRINKKSHCELQDFRGAEGKGPRPTLMEVEGS